MELGLARFGGIDKVHIDEPLVLLLAANEFVNAVHSSDTHVKIPLRKDSGRPEDFERYIAFYLSWVFDGGKRLCDVLSFGEKPPRFAEERAELVSITLTDDVVETSVFNLLSGEAATSAIGFDPKKWEHKAMDHTMEWLRNPWTLMCFPGEQMGPNIVLFVRVAGAILAVLVQCKWRVLSKSYFRLYEEEGSIDINEVFYGRVCYLLSMGGRRDLTFFMTFSG